MRRGNIRFMDKPKAFEGDKLGMKMLSARGIKLA